MLQPWVLGSLGAWELGSSGVGAALCPTIDYPNPFHPLLLSLSTHMSPVPSLPSADLIILPSATRNLTLPFVCLYVNLVGLPVSSCPVLFCASLMLYFYYSILPHPLPSSCLPSIFIVTMTITVHYVAPSSILTPVQSRHALCSLRSTPASACGWQFHQLACSSPRLDHLAPIQTRIPLPCSCST